MDNEQRHLAAILFTDIVGYTAVMQHNEQQALVIVKRHRQVLEKYVALHFGSVLDYYGDGSLSVFPSATHAVSCAVEIQKEFREEPVIPLRIGLHIGEIFFDDGTPYGNGVNIASRIQSLGEANTILLSKEILDKIRNNPTFNTVPLGLFEFKNVDEPMEVFALSNEGLFVPKRENMTGKLKEKSTSPPFFSIHHILRKTAIVSIVLFIVALGTYYLYQYLSGQPQTPIKENALAVLYFENISGDPEQEYFSDGVTEEIIGRLSMINGLRVKSRTAVLPYKSKEKSSKEIAKELGVSNILEGSIRKQGDSVRILAQLINTETEEPIWTEMYNMAMKDIFQVQSSIAHQIATKFQVLISSDTEKHLQKPSTLNSEAYDIYLKALSLTYLDFGLGGKQPNRQKATVLLKQAISLDPHFSDAYALLSASYSYLSMDAKDPKPLLDSAEMMAQKAIQLGPNIVKGYRALAFYHETKGNLDEALKWLYKVHQIAPYSTAGWMSAIYRRKKDFGKGFEWIMNAIEYDPTDIKHYLAKVNLFYDVGLLDSMKKYIDIAKRANPESMEVDNASFLYYLRTNNYPEFRRVNRFRLANDDKEFAYNMAMFFLFQRDWVKADSLYKLSSHPDDMDAGLVKLRLGETEEGRKYLNKTIENRLRFKDFKSVWHYFDISRAYAALGDNRYIEYWQKAVDNGWHDYAFIIRDPFFDTVRNTPEYQKLEDGVKQRNEQYKKELFTSMQNYYSNPDRNINIAPKFLFAPL